MIVLYRGGVGIMNKKGVTYEYHHMGIPVTKEMPGEKYSESFDMWTTHGHNPFRIQYHRFGPKCSLHALVQTVPHVAFKVNSIEKAIEGEHVLLEPYEPIVDFRVAMIEVDGAPVELIETSLTEDAIWKGDHRGSVIYPDKD